MMLLSTFLTLLSCRAALAASSSSAPPSAYTVPGAFPTSVYDSYWNDPTATSAQPQPVITDPVTNTIFPENLTNPETFPKNDTVDLHPLPSTSNSSELLNTAIAQIAAIATNPAFEGNKCAQCQASLEVAKFLVMAAPEQGPLLAEAVCEYFNYSDTCYDEYSVLALGSVFSQVVALANVGGYDGQNLCSRFDDLCPIPPAVPLNMTGWFAKPKPNPLPPPKQPSGERLKVLHVSDIHIDPRACRSPCSPKERQLTGMPSVFLIIPLIKFCSLHHAMEPTTGNLFLPVARLVKSTEMRVDSDTPLELMLAAMEAIPELTGTADTGFNFSLFTGDLTAHDTDNQYSRYVVLLLSVVLDSNAVGLLGLMSSTPRQVNVVMGQRMGLIFHMNTYQVIVYNLLKKYFGPPPVYATVGNHDTYVQFQMIPYWMGGTLGQQFNWLYEHISSMWSYEGWLPEESVQYASTHYAAYSVQRPDGLRIISIDTDIWYRDNYFGYIDSEDPDPFGVLRFLTDELQAAEDAGDRVWIIGHVLAGWDGSAAQSNPTNLFYQIVDRFSPHVIANIFWGHTHQDQLSIFYANNGTAMNADTALAVSWIGPSITPLTNLNSGFRMYEVDSATFDVLDSYTWISPVNEFPALDNQTEYGPTYQLEYSAREAYGQNITWGANDPLNATWWHLVTEQMEYNSSLVELFYIHESKSSAASSKCTGSCINDTICYIRSGSAPVALQNC
ncbi:sphingomyelin phosphodiesterase [Chiua virens]|nr:sphingomyelin phosphodiesterase [Chiua virens]